jgi:hypothetical protein
MYCFNLMFLFVDEPASDSALPQGYRGVGYNPNFENADEYPPSQTPVQANTRKIIDLSKPNLHYFFCRGQYVPNLHYYLVLFHVCR